ncbi:MAG: GTP cyclohydrolase FolE2 [Verrucomicrobiota bacterium]
MHAPQRSELKDTQSEPDYRGIAIDRVGVKGLKYPIRVQEKGGSGQETVATITLTVDLPHHYKGTHMSRFVEILSGWGFEFSSRSLVDLLPELMGRLDSARAHVDVEFPFFVRKEAPASGAIGLMDYLVRFNATGEASECDLVTTVKVNVTTLCPCSKAISERGAHNQRGEVTFSARTDGFMWVEDMIEMVEQSASSELYSLLKRPDEKVVTERAYDHPVFVEDLVRNVAQRAKDHDQILWYRIEAENFESIHNHNAYAMIVSDGRDEVAT